MGLITWVIAVVALLLGASALYLQISGPEPIDFQQCTIVNSGSSGSPSQTTCNQLCGQNSCVLGLHKFSELITIDDTKPELNSQESLISCNENAVYGTLQENDEIETYSLGCVCCS